SLAMNRDSQIRRTNPAIAQQSALRDLGFGFLSSFVIRHSPVSDRFPSCECQGSVHLQKPKESCYEKAERSLAMNVSSTTGASPLTRRQFLKSLDRHGVSHGSNWTGPPADRRFPEMTMKTFLHNMLRVWVAITVATLGG